MADKQNRSGGYEERKEVTIKFGKGLMEAPFTSKAGKELVEIKIPNVDRSDTRPWESFVVPANYVHENQYGKGMWMKLPEDGTTKLSRGVFKGKDESGKPIWGRETREVSNVELKALVEAYKDRDRSSVMSDLSGKKAEAGSRGAASRSNRSHDEPPFR